MLTEFEGKPVVYAAVAVTNAGDGLSEALRVDPAELHQGDTVTIVMEGLVTKVEFAPADKADPAGPQIRKHIIRAGVATLVDPDLVSSAIEAQRERNLRAREQAAGIERLSLDGDDD